MGAARLRRPIVGPDPSSGRSQSQANASRPTQTTTRWALGTGGGAAGGGGGDPRHPVGSGPRLPTRLPRHPRRRGGARSRRVRVVDGLGGSRAGPPGPTGPPGADDRRPGARTGRGGGTGRRADLAAAPAGDAGGGRRPCTARPRWPSSTPGHSSSSDRSVRPPGPASSCTPAPWSTVARRPASDAPGVARLHRRHRQAALRHRLPGDRRARRDHRLGAVRQPVGHRRPLPRRRRRLVLCRCGTPRGTGSCCGRPTPIAASPGPPRSTSPRCRPATTAWPRSAHIDAAKPDLPPHTVYVVVAGAVHSDFGDYGTQRGDGTPISHHRAQSEIEAASLALLERVDRAPCEDSHAGTRRTAVAALPGQCVGPCGSPALPPCYRRNDNAVTRPQPVDSRRVRIPDPHHRHGRPEVEKGRQETLAEAVVHPPAHPHRILDARRRLAARPAYRRRGG